jgi:serine/threonine protein kinase
MQNMMDGVADDEDASTQANSLADPVAPKNLKSKSEKKATTASLDNYRVLNDLGEGAYGQVFLAMEKTTGQHLAIKAVNILKICQVNKERHILREKDLLDSLRFKHNNIINLLSTFKVSLNGDQLYL